MTRVGLELGDGYVAIVPYGTQLDPRCFIEADFDCFEEAKHKIIIKMIYEELKQLMRADDDGMRIKNEREKDE